MAIRIRFLALLFTVQPQFVLHECLQVAHRHIMVLVHLLALYTGILQTTILFLRKVAR